MLSVNIESHIIGSGGMHQISYRLISKVKLVIELSVITGQCAIEKTKTTHPDPVKLAWFFFDLLLVAKFFVNSIELYNVAYLIA